MSFLTRISSLGGAIDSSITRYKDVALDSGWIIFLTILQKLCGLAATYVLVRYLSKEGYGEYSFVLAVLSFVSVFSLPRLDDTIIQSVSRNFRGTFRHSIGIKFLSSLTGSVVLIALAVWFYTQQQLNVSYAFVVVAVLFPFSYGASQWNSFLLGIKNFKQSCVRGGVQSVLISAAIIISLFLFPYNILAPLISAFVARALYDVLMTGFIYFFQTKPEDPYESGSVKYAIKTSFWGLLSQLSMVIDKIVIFSFLSPANLALYVVAEKLPEMFKGLVKSVATALAPRFATQEKYTQKLDRLIGYFSLTVFFSFVAFSIFILPTIFLLIFGEEYKEAVIYSQIMMIVVALFNMAPIKGRFFKSKLDEDSMRKFILYTSFIRIFSAFLLIPYFGLNGAIASYFIGRLTTHFAVEVIMKKKYKAV